MKKIIILLLLIISSKLIGQGAPVYDNAANLQLREMNIQMRALNKLSIEKKITLTKTFKEGLKQTKLLNKSIQILEKVNKNLKQLTDLVNITKKAYKIIEMNYNLIYDLQKKLKENKISKDTYNQIVMTLNLLVDNVNSYVKLIRSLLKDNFVKGNDVQRLSLLTEYKTKIDEIYMKMYQINNVYKEFYHLSNQLITPLKL